MQTLAGSQNCLINKLKIKSALKIHVAGNDALKLKTPADMLRKYAEEKISKEVISFIDAVFSPQPVRDKMLHDYIMHPAWKSKIDEFFNSKKTEYKNFLGFAARITTPLRS